MVGTLSVSAPVRSPREMGGKPSSKRRWFPPMRFSRPRAPISFSALYKRLREDMHVNAERYHRLGDLVLYAGVLTVLVLSAYVLFFGGG